MIAIVAVLAAATMTPGDEVAAIRLLRARHNAALAARDLKGAMALAAPDYVLTGGSGGTLRTARAAEQAWRAQFADPAYAGYVRTPATIEVGVADGVLRAAESGAWTGRFGDARLHGRYFVHWRKLAGGWRTVAETYVTLGEDAGD